jgi:DNA-binding NtrC family response regulator
MAVPNSFLEKATSRTVVVVSADPELRRRLRASLSGMRWQVRDACGGAEAMAKLEDQAAEAVLLDAWLPDLEVGECAAQMEGMFPGMDVLRADGSALTGSGKSPRRHELLHALREVAITAAGLSAEGAASRISRGHEVAQEQPEEYVIGRPAEYLVRRPAAKTWGAETGTGIEDLVGASAGMLELARLIRLVAPRSATVLIEGETGTGKEVVAKAVHRLSTRAHKPFVVLNCAAIPESLLEAELFGHTRGAFTGAVHSRTGRIEAAHGGTLFLDEIGEMPLALQAKMLRFLESGEIQRVGENDTMRVDVRVIAATHQPLEKRSADGTFRLDLYHRLAVFPLEVPPLRDRLEDIELLAEHLLTLLGRSAPRKLLAPEALERLKVHDWPGNVRELAHVLERGSILAGDAPYIRAEEIRVRRAARIWEDSQALEDPHRLQGSQSLEHPHAV